MKMIKKEALSQDGLHYYDLTIPKTHTYVLANGAVVHNCGTGVGYSVERQFVDNLPVVAPLTGKVVEHVVVDSTDGWADSLYFGLTQWFSGNRVLFDYSGVRPRGAILKTKGGRASGPEPLKRLHDLCETTILAASGRKLRPIECHDIACTIGEIVMVGGFRRAALISISDPDDEEMRHAKDWSRGEFPKCRYMANNSAFWSERPDEATFWAEWNALVASKSGERGFQIDSWHRRAERPKGMVRTNPCVTGETRVMTSRGLVQIRDLVGQPVDVAVDRRFGVGTMMATTDTGAFKTGSREVFRLNTTEGYSVRLTAEHRVMTSDGWKEARNLGPGDLVHIANTEGMFGSMGSADMGLLAGWVTGDGCLLAEDNNSPRLYFYGADRPLIEQMLDATARLVGSRPAICEGEKWDRQHFECAALRVHLGQVISDKFRVPDFVYQGTRECQAAYLSALFSADGSVCDGEEKGVSVRLHSTKMDLLRDVQQVLLTFGIASRIYRDRRPAGWRDLPDGKGGYKSCFCEANHDLCISKVNLVRFYDQIQLVHTGKRDALATIVERYKRGPNRESFTARFESLVPDGVEDVYDVTVPGPEAFVANGIVVHNCAEIGLRYLPSTDPWTGEGGGGQFCVAGDTPLITREGLTTIREAVGRPVHVWNGTRWSEVTPLQTGVGQKLYRVHLSDGSYLDCTDYHRFSVAKPQAPHAWQAMTVSELRASKNATWATEPFTIVYEDGEAVGAEWASHLGAFLGVRSLGGEQVCDPPMEGCPRNWSEMSPVLDVDGLFSWKREAILHLLGGWLDAIESPRFSRLPEAGASEEQVLAWREGVRLSISSEEDARKMQLLLTRCGIRSIVRWKSRNVWYLILLDCADIPSRHLDRGWSPDPQPQMILSIEELVGSHPTFCFEELERHMGVFGNTLTYQCNLTAAVMRAEDTRETMAEKIRIAAWLGAIQSSFTYFPYLRDGWRKTCDEDRLLGVDITGQCDNPRLSQDPEVMRYFNQVARETAAEASAYLGINMPVAVTCGKPSGNSSQMVDCASGFHPRYAPYYLRRVRVDGKDPLTALMRDSGVPLFKENGMEHLPDAEVSVWVAQFPVKAPEGAMLRNSETAVQMCERYLHVMRTWCAERGHNQSVTIYVHEHEWEEVGRWVYEHFDEITGLSFLPFDGGRYKLAPYEEITRAEYEAALAKMPEVDFGLLTHYEREDRGQGSAELACVSGACEM